MSLKSKIFDFRFKNNRAKYFIAQFIRLYIPKFIVRRRYLFFLSKTYAKRASEINARVNYYNSLLNVNTNLGEDRILSPKDKKLPKRRKVYFFDAFQYFRVFKNTSSIRLLEGDVTTVQDVPTIVKSRPINADKTNSILLNLDKVRHFIFVKDKTFFESKRDIAIFRARNIAPFKSCRRILFEKYLGHKRVDVGLATKATDIPPEWKVEETSMLEQLNYKYILCPEGNDVATNLKWVMSSNSIAIMPKPVYETWFMEGLLKDGVHYIEVKDDYSDLLDKMDYYSKNIEEANRIITNAHLFVNQFTNKRVEDATSVLVLNKYLQKTGQEHLEFNI